MIVRQIYTGKVRDIYEDEDTNELILVASDRISVFDVNLPTPIPDKGKILTQLSLWWFQHVGDIIEHHVLSATDVPDQWRGRAIRCKRLEMIPIECVARGYLTGAATREYEKDGSICGIDLPPGLLEASRFSSPIFTPTTKTSSDSGKHDELITFTDLTLSVGKETAERLQHVTLKVYQRCADIAQQRGIIVADTKLEFGWDDAGNLVLGDELLSPDSARFWRAADWVPGKQQFALDKQFVRDWAAGLDWNREPPAPPVPTEIVAATRQRYIDVYQQITELDWVEDRR
jgi:phosphoribosylaminoimidazole-succinocarboxamide synthase